MNSKRESVRRKFVLMKAQRFVLGSAIFLAVASAQVSKQEALSQLRKIHPTAIWNSKPTAVADVLCEGKPATIILGSEDKTVVVGVVSGLPEHKTEILSFPIRADREDGFCAFPGHIKT